MQAPLSCPEGSYALLGPVQLNVDIRVFGWACYTKRWSTDIEPRKLLLFASAQPDIKMMKEDSDHGENLFPGKFTPRTQAYSTSKWSIG